MPVCRRVLLFPRGNNVDQLSIYLDVADSNQLPSGWTRFAHFNLAVLNQYEPKMSVRKGLALLACLLFYLFVSMIFRCLQCCDKFRFRCASFI